MRPFTAGELSRIKAEDEAMLGDNSGIGFSAAVKAIPAGTDPDARTTVVASLDCGRLHEMDEREKERANMATITRARRVKAKYDANVTARHRLIYGGVDYRIVFVRHVPVNDPQYMVLFLEDEGVSA